MPAEPTRFKWSEMPFDQPTRLIDRRRIVGEKAMISHVTLYKGFEVATHSHENEQISCILSGCLRFGLGNREDPAYREIDLKGGEALLLPSFAPHSAVALEDTIVLDVFSPPSETTGVDAHG